MSNNAEWVKRLGVEAARHRRSYIRSMLAFAAYFFLEAIWILIGYDVTQNASRNVAALVTVFVSLACFTVVFLVEAHCQRVAVKSASAALKLELLGVKALPEPALRSLPFFDAWTHARGVSWVEPTL